MSKKTFFIIIALLLVAVTFTSCGKNIKELYPDFFCETDSDAAAEVKTLILKMNDCFNSGDYKGSVSAFEYDKNELNDYVAIQKEIAKKVDVKRTVSEIELSEWSDAYITAYITTVTTTLPKDAAADEEPTEETATVTYVFTLTDGKWKAS